MHHRFECDRTCLADPGSPSGEEKNRRRDKKSHRPIAFSMLMYLTLSRPHREIVSTDEY
jgi:hypothetical protein